MQEGLYERLLTEALDRELRSIPERLASVVERVDEADQPEVLARHLREAAVRALASTRDVDTRIAIVNRLIALLGDVEDSVASGPRQLLAITEPARPGRAARPVARPRTPLSDAALLTNAAGEPTLGAELRAEIDSSDAVDLLCAFVKWYGLRVLEPELARLRQRGRSLRVITTTYMGATERQALDRLVRDFSAQVKIQYDAVRTRLHAKAWLFSRNTGYDTAYVGSSNLSRSALLEGVEWNVRLSHVATPTLLEKFRATFETYWNDPTFEAYDPDSTRDRDRLDDALAEAGRQRSGDRVTISLSGLEVRPYAYQADMLESLEVERQVHGRHRNLIVAATGTGKTVVAALDYRRLCEQADPSGSAASRPTLLFVAHRKEILDQSLRTYREVVADAAFGEQYVGGARPERWRHVFASVQSLTAYDIRNIPADAFEIVVIDEFHHAEAATYRRIIEHLLPRELLGLTATPERTDGTDVRSYFDGRTAAELRLWDALSADLLCPFHYFGIADGTDLRGIEWKRGRYDERGLDNVYTGNDMRAALVLKQVRDKLVDVGAMRALGFCVSVAHSQYMAEVFNRVGIPALSVTGETAQKHRAAALDDLRSRRVNVLFTADLFNEGLDLPEIDTVLFLRPTESATIFLQQLGRGLRQAHGKAVLTVLDFVGHHRREFRFDMRFRALTGSTRRALERQVSRGFPFLPSGCQIVLDDVAQSIVLDSLRGQISSRWAQIVAELRSYGDQDLPTFLAESGVELSDVLRGDHSWTRLRREAGLSTRSGGSHENPLLKRVRALAHVDDRDRATAYAGIVADEPVDYSAMPPNLQPFARMLFWSLWPDGGGFASYDDGLRLLHAEPAVRDELGAVIAMSFNATRHQALPLAGRLGGLPLRVHARYQREEILAALGHARLSTATSPKRAARSFMEGVWFSKDLQADAFFVTLKKSEADYSPTTMYRDYAISPTLFHWESQSTTSVASPTGQRYLTHLARGSEVLLFSRDRGREDLGTAPYLFLGPATYVSHTGDRPIAIIWRLAHAMPTDVFTQASVAAS